VGSYQFFVCLGARNSGLFLGCWFLIRGALLIKREQAFENLFVGKIDRKTVALSDGGIEFCVRVRKPGGTLVVKIRECTFR
jgi:hypothetical protein